MLPKQHRLSLRTGLKKVKKQGTLIQGDLFSLLISRQQGIKQPSRFGFIISTKIHKKAVKRNRVKRLLSEAIQGLLLKIEPGFETVFLVRKKVIDASLSEIEKGVKKLFIEAGVMKS